MTDLEKFLHDYGMEGAQVVDVPDGDSERVAIVIRHGDITALVLAKGLGAHAGMGPHLSVDVRAFVDGGAARTGLFGMDEGGRALEGFREDQAVGTSHGRPAARLVALLVGDQR